ncbi:MAG: hypothetical protein AAGC67_05355 [Myxococcota bacterium]
MQNRPRVGEILVSAGIIDEMQLESALGEQKQWGRRLGVTLIKMGMVEEGHLIRALAKQLDLPVASLAGKRIPEDVIALVPARVASEHGVIPLFTKDGGRNGQLYLGMEDPSNLAVLDDLSFRTGMEIHPVMVGPTELGEAIDRYYHTRNGGAPQQDPFKGGDTMNPGSLRVVTDDSPQPGTAPAEPSIESEIQAAANGRAASAAEPPIELNDEVEPTRSVPAPSSLREGLSDDVARLGVSLESLRRELARVSEDLVTVRGSVSTVEREVSSVRDDLASGDGGRGGTNEDLASVKRDVGRLDEAIAELRADFGRLSDGLADLTAMRDGVTEARQEATRAKDVATGAEAAVADAGEAVKRADEAAATAGEAAQRADEGAARANELATRACDESERTRIVAKAITTLLVENGTLGLDALQAQISLLKAAAEADDGADFEPLDG